MKNQPTRFQFAPENKPLKRAGVYRITHIDSGKLYIGISANLAQRVVQHACPKGRNRLANAIRLHSPAAFLFEPLFYCLDGADDPCFLPTIEAQLIAEHDSVRFGYNILEANGRVGPYGPEFSKTVAAVHARRTSEERSDIARRGKAAMGAERRSAAAKAGALTQGSDALSKRMKETQAKRTPEQKRTAGILGGKASSAATTAEQKREKSLKGAATKLANTTAQQRREAFYSSPIGQFTSEQLSENGRKGIFKANSKRSPQERSALASRAAVALHQSRTPEERRALARKAGAIGGKVIANRDKEQLSESSKKAWDKRRLLGKTSTPTKGGRWINDGRSRKRLPAGDSLPAGWSYGWVLGQTED